MSLATLLTLLYSTPSSPSAPSLCPVVWEYMHSNREKEKKDARVKAKEAQEKKNLLDALEVSEAADELNPWPDDARATCSASREPLPCFN